MHSSTWKEVKRRVDTLTEPSRSELVGARAVEDGSHGEGNNRHTLKEHSFLIEKVPDAYELLFKYAVCPNCQELRWKKFIAYNLRDGLAYERVLVKKGKSNDKDEQNVLEAMR